MTTTVTVQAHCASNKEVVISKSDDGLVEPSITVIQDGEEHSDVVYDNVAITVKEREK